MITTETTGTSATNFTNYCAHRMPCGVCRMMMTPCPIWNGCGVTVHPTWVSTINAKDIKTGETKGVTE